MKQQNLSSMYWIVLVWVVVAWGCSRTLNNANSEANQPNVNQALGDNILVEIETPEVISEPAEPKPMLTVEVRGAKSKQGVYSVALFDNEDDFSARTNSIASAKLPASESDPVWKVDSIEPGTYALAVFHDENENEKLDRHALGYPTEVYGFSNNARAKFGPPPFADAKFTFADEDVEMRIEIR